jgi:serine/threonine-protein kinase
MIGSTIAGKYRCEALIARGGMGRIYKAIQEPLGRAVAVKVLTADDAPEIRRGMDEARFYLEASIASRLVHPNTVVIHDYGALEHKTGYYIAMELLDGKSLARELRDAGPLPLHRAVHILEQLCGSLAEAHGHGVVHRDLKPLNVILVERGGDPDFVKLVDFGLVKWMDEGVHHDHLTEQNAIVGSPLCIAPEQILGEHVDGRTDIYALGVLAFETLTGRAPFVREEEKGGPGYLLRGHLMQVPPKLRDVQPDLAFPEAVEDIIARCLAKQPADRFPSMEAVARAFRRASPNVATPIAALSDPELVAVQADAATQHAMRTSLGRRTPDLEAPLRSAVPWRVGAGIGVAAAVVLGVWLVARDGPTSSPSVAPLASSRAAVSGADAVIGRAPELSTPELTPAGPAAVEAASRMPADPRGMPPGEVPVVAPRVERVGLHFASIPEGAQIRRQGAVLGRTPHVLLVTRAELPYEVVLKLEGYHPELVRADVGPSVTAASLSRTLRPLAVAAPPRSGKPKAPKKDPGVPDSDINLHR